MLIARTLNPGHKRIALLLIMSVSLLFELPSTVCAYSTGGSKSINDSSNHAGRKLSPKEVKETMTISNRRDLFRGAFASIPVIAIAATQAASEADAFDNRLDEKYAGATPQSGTQPSDLGHGDRSSRTKGSYNGLKACGTSPNCWCSSAPFADAPARYIAPWSGNSIQDMKKVIDTYKVGQNGIDGGGFKVIDYDEKEQYLYVQFQSFKAGYIDDLECWFNPASGKFDVRSSSRVGMSDLGVNAKRLEYIGARLEKEFGWTLERRKNGSLV
jgi:uncharacterized protein (DUF1499 family)